MATKPLIEEVREQIFQLELELIEMRRATEEFPGHEKWVLDKLDMVKAHLEQAARVCMHIQYPETEPDYVGGEE